MLDTLRADRLSAYGNPRPTSPVLDALAEEGVLFEQAVTHAPWTLPATTALLTGEVPPVTRSFSMLGWITFHRFLERSLVRNLKNAGFRTAAFVEGGFVSKLYGFSHGFHVYFEHEAIVAPFILVKGRKVPVKRRADPDDPSRGIARTFSEARRWLEEKAEEPFFLWVHTYETHMPYTRREFAEGMDPGRLGPIYGLEQSVRLRALDPPPTDAELEYVRALYDGGVATADRHVGELLATLESLGLRDRTLVVVTSDHGEDLGDRSRSRAGHHGNALYDEQVRVPLIIADPTRRYRARRVTEQVRTIDVMPTVLDLLGLPPVPGKDGRSLVPLMRGRDDAPHLAFLTTRPRMVQEQPVLSGLRTGGEKVIVERPREAPDAPGPPLRVEAYDLRHDPGERHNLAHEPGGHVAELIDALAQLEQHYVQLAPAGEDAEAAPGLDRETEERLRALGYAE